MSKIRENMFPGAHSYGSFKLLPATPLRTPTKNAIFMDLYSLILKQNEKRKIKKDT